MYSTVRHGFWAVCVLALIIAFQDVSKAVSGKAHHDDTKQVFRFANGNEPESLDPHRVSGIPEKNILKEMFEGLVVNNPKTLEPEPGVAERWTVSGDGLTYHFWLRADARWSDGKPVVAGDFVYSWLRALDPKTASPMAPFFYPIQGAEAFNQGKLKDESKLGFKAISDRELEVKLAEPTHYFLFLLTFHPFAPLPEWVIKKYDTRWIRPENLVCNGPFKLALWKPYQTLRLEPNPEYWDRKSVKLDAVIFDPTDDSETAFKKYETGSLDMHSATLPATRIPLLKKRRDFHSISHFGTYFYRFNTALKPFDDPRVRKALSLSIERSLVTDRVLKGGQKPLWSFTPIKIGGYMPPQGERFNPTRAQSLLASAGFCVPGGKAKKECREFPKFEILISNRWIHEAIATAVIDMWRKHLGIKNVAMDRIEWKSYIKRTRSIDYQVSFGSWIGDYLDPYAFLEIWQTGSPNNRTGWSNQTYDKLLFASKKSVKKSERLDLLGQAEALFLSELPAAPIYRYSTNYLLKPYVRGIYPNIMAIHPLKHVEIAHKQ